MGKKIVLFDKIYIIKSERTRQDIFSRYLKYLNERYKGFTSTRVKIKKLRDFDKRFAIEIFGPDEVFVMNIIKKEVGTITELKDVRIGQEYKGTMVDVGKFGFGIFVDCAILDPKIDVLLNLFTLRKQLCNDKEKSTRDIIKAYDFIDHYPIHLKIVKIDLENKKIQGEIAERTLKMYKKIIDENIEGIFACGTTKSQFKKALINTGHLRDIISLERFSFLEHIVLLKEDTNAPGIISNIGRYLKNCKLSALRPQKIKDIFC